MYMSDYKFFIIILLITSVIVLAGVSYAQISEQISSPKKQIDTGIVPHYVICKNDLLLVERPNGKIACVHIMLFIY